MASLGRRGYSRQRDQVEPSCVEPIKVILGRNVIATQAAIDTSFHRLFALGRGRCRKRIGDDGVKSVGVLHLPSVSGGSKGGILQPCRVGTFVYGNINRVARNARPKTLVDADQETSNWLLVTWAGRATTELFSPVPASMVLK